MKTKIFSIVLCIVMLFCATVVAGASEDGKTFLSIGDSISTGYGLKNPTSDGFTYKIVGANDSYINKAVAGNTAQGILSQLKNPWDPDYITKEQIAAADIVTITCGGNDLMDVLYSKILDKWNAKHPGQNITLDELYQKALSNATDFVPIVMELLNPKSDSYLIKGADFANALNAFASSLKEITDYIYSINQRAVIIVATQYNPYAEFKGVFLIGSVYNGMEDGVSKLNEVISGNAGKCGYIVCDAKKEFDNYSGKEDLYNADVLSMNVDFHPTAAGHRVLADAFSKTLSSIVYSRVSIVRLYEALDGTYEEEKTEYKSAVGRTVTATIDEKEGFSFDGSNPGNVLSAYLTGNDATLKVYYSRNSYTFSWDIDGNIVSHTYKYGEEVMMENAPSKEGFTFEGWTPEVPSVMPSHDVTVKAVWTENDIPAPSEDESSEVESSEISSDTPSEEVSSEDESFDDESSEKTSPDETPTANKGEGKGGKFIIKILVIVLLGVLLFGFVFIFIKLKKANKSSE